MEAVACKWVDGLIPLLSTVCWENVTETPHYTDFIVATADVMIFTGKHMKDFWCMKIHTYSRHLASSVSINTRQHHIGQMKRAVERSPWRQNDYFWTPSQSALSLSLVTAILKGGRQLVAWNMHSIIRSDQGVHGEGRERQREGLKRIFIHLYMSWCCLLR